MSVAVGNLVPNHVDVDLADRREDAIQNLFDVGSTRSERENASRHA